ncbi:type 2 lantipeptide synthetase LanM [Phyllobacterium salinisoli]|uniref:Type 2 lantipeptide synthetase LanM n=1 Tax=Phyllobacterium salinisoli TaxID=1899321 RepID=A0A368JW52_9HYPH|nr:type 2 lanthipeptide synthetase LanM [Phyllobacterium salinisoli]RCS21396.1 type 2 lantipeptide synthetase LanM [Phyllobacterium salinisoli]
MSSPSFGSDVFSEIYRHILINSEKEILQLQNSLIPKEALNKCFESAFLPILRKAWERPLILEMNFANQDGLLQGDSEVERFKFFVREVCKPENFTALCEKYPGLWESWQREMGTCTAFLKCLIGHVKSDIESAADHFYGDATVAVIGGIYVIGDPHRGMRQAARVEYINKDGLNRTLYYKPRSLAIDEGFNSFIVWWNHRFPIDHCVPRALNRGDYGWTEAIVQRECETTDQVRSFYRRYGSLMALMHLFAATDLHMENIIASGEYPVIVDLETLFSCTLEAEKHHPTNGHIYATLLLPTDTVHGAVEISPLSAQAKAQTDIDVLVNPQQRTCFLKMEEKKAITGDTGSQVIFKSEGVDFSKHEQDVISGIRETLTLLYLNRDCVLAAIKENMGGSQVRIIVQPTDEYGKILYNIYHPNSLRNKGAALDARALCSGSRDADIMESEIADLGRGDIPYFQMPFDEPVLTNGLGNELSTAVFQSPRQKLEYQFSRLTPAFIDEVVEDTKYAFLAHRVRRGEECVGQKLTCNRMLAAFSDNQWLDELALVAMNGIMCRVLHIGGRYYWRNMHVTAELTIRAGLSEVDLYQGIAGIALAFHVVGQRQSCSRFLNFARCLASQVADQLDDLPVELGALSGTAGVLWAICTINADQLTWLLSTIDRELAKLAYRLVTETFEKYEQLDFLAGVSGTLSMLLRLHRLYCEYPIGKEIAWLADFSFTLLKNKADALLDDKATLLGFAHGTAGVSASLAEYMSYFGREDRDAIAIILRNLKRETRYRTERGWPRFDQNDACNTSWCHGTVGIGYSRLLCRPYIPADVYESDMSTVKARLGEDQASLCLCHGMTADYYLARALGLDGTEMLYRIRKEVEAHSIKTDFGLNGFEIVGALTGVSSLFVGDAILFNKI